MRSVLLAAVSGLCFLTPGLALADDNPLADADIFGPIVSVVEITRLALSPADAPEVITVNRDEIEARQSVFAMDILQTVPGISIARNGAFGGVAYVRQRGATADKTLVVIDGIPQNDPSSPAGGYDFANLGLDDIDHIEILSGPQGSLWGSDAIGGVIAFTTRRLDGWRFNLEGGSFGTLAAAGGLGVAGEDRGGSVTLSGLRTDGISKADAADGNTEKDGYWTWNGALKAYLTLGPVRIDSRLAYNRSHAEIDGFPCCAFTLADTAEVAVSEGWSGYVRGRLQGPWGFAHQLSFSSYDIDRDSLGGGFFARYQARRDVWRWTAARGAPGDVFGLLVGAEYEDTTATLSDLSSADRTSASAFAIARYSPVEALTVIGALRYDDPSAYGAKVTARVSANYALTSGLSVFAAWGQGYKTPTISQLACDFCFPGGPSVGLKPESARGYEVSLRWRSGGLDLRATLYRLTVRDQIDFSSSFPFRYANLEATRTDGRELLADWEISPAWRLRGSYAWTDARDTVLDTQLVRVPEHSGAAALFWTGQGKGLTFTLRAESRQADSPAPRGGFVVADLAGYFDLNDTVRLTARVENLADTHYQEVFGYGEPGISLYVGVRMRSN